MKKYFEMTDSERAEELKTLRSQLEEYKNLGLKLNMARGLPSKAQLDMVSDILTVLQDPEDCIADGLDARNYGELTGLKEAKELFADILGCRSEECFIGGSASLTLMYDLIARAYSFGLLHSEKPWSQLEKVKWLCPAPGYDRHFRITETFGAELITVPMTPDGPDMDLVEELVKDPEVKGIWCVPKYSNPQGFVYSSETMHRFANLKPAAKDFTVMWDNAYCVHEFDGEFEPFEDIITLFREAGNPDMVYEFASTSKITFPGAGISVMATSVDNQNYLKKLIGVQMISYDKVNQLRHVKYLQDKEHTLQLMKRHAQFMKPKFDCVKKHLEEEIAPAGIATWENPKGGYFVSVDTQPGLAKRTLELCREAGVVMTGAGAAFPYGIDPEDKNIRIAPSFPPIEDLDKAMSIFCICMKIAALEK